jgi:Na+-driven multidrug efflux pump
VRQLFSVSSPLVARRLAQGLVIFPLLAVAATFGPAVIAAVGVARRVRELLNSFTWGFSIAASTLVGQSLGASEVTQATDYSREIAKLSLVAYLFVALVVAALANPIADIFVDGDAIPLTEMFVLVAAVSSVALGVDGTVTGALRGAGDTRIPFLATLTGLYLVALPLAYLGSATALGLTGLLLALIAETGVPMVVNVLRFRTGAWVDAGRAYRPRASDD